MCIHVWISLCIYVHIYLCMHACIRMYVYNRLYARMPWMRLQQLKTQGETRQGRRFRGVASGAACKEQLEGGATCAPLFRWSAQNSKGSQHNCYWVPSTQAKGKVRFASKPPVGQGLFWNRISASEFIIKVLRNK